MSYGKEESIRKEKSPPYSASEDEDDFDYEQHWRSGGPQGVNNTCEVPGCTTPTDRVRCVQTCNGTEYRCYNHRGQCTLFGE